MDRGLGNTKTLYQSLVFLVSVSPGCRGNSRTLRDADGDLGKSQKLAPELWPSCCLQAGPDPCPLSLFSAALGSVEDATLCRQSPDTHLVLPRGQECLGDPSIAPRPGRGVSPSGQTQMSRGLCFAAAKREAPNGSQGDPATHSGSWCSEPTELHIGARLGVYTPHSVRLAPASAAPPTKLQAKRTLSLSVAS